MMRTAICLRRLLFLASSLRQIYNVSSFLPTVTRYPPSCFGLIMASPTSTSSFTALPPQPWYSHPNLGRDRSHVLDAPCTLNEIQNSSTTIDWSSSRFILIFKNGMWHQTEPNVAPLLLEHTDLVEMIRKSTAVSDDGEETESDTRKTLLAWVGKYEGIDYWVAYIPVTVECPGIIQNNNHQASICCKPLREFGDLLASHEDAGILATAQGLVEFHKSHPFCSLCGGATRPAKAGACRKCISCEKSVYPRLDVAAIMLVTSPCQQYALLGRKKNWPAGRYSTLAGFCEVGETLEDCCRRETLEESGVVVDPASIEFVASQPWPFPRSLMVGFRATACGSLSSDEKCLPKIEVDTSEMQDIQWFAKDFVRERLEGGSTALSYEPNGKEADFHIPGKSSLARLLITRWTEET